MIELQESLNGPCNSLYVEIVNKLHRGTVFYKHLGKYVSVKWRDVSSKEEKSTRNHHSDYR